MIARMGSIFKVASPVRASRVFAPRRFAHDSFAALNIMKDPAVAPVEKVGTPSPAPPTSGCGCFQQA